MAGRYSVADLVRELEAIRIDLLKAPPTTNERRDALNASLANVMQESEHSSRASDIISNAQRGLQLADDAVAIRRKAATELDHYVETHLKGGASTSSASAGARWTASGCETHAQLRKARMDGWALAGVIVGAAGNAAKGAGLILDATGVTPFGLGSAAGVAAALLLTFGHKQAEATFRSGLSHTERRKMRVQSWKDAGKGFAKLAWKVIGKCISEDHKVGGVSLKEMYENADTFKQIGELAIDVYKSFRTYLGRGGS